MGKMAPDDMIDASLDYVALSTLMVLCSAEPTDYNDAVNVVDIADAVMAGADYTIADDVSGRKVTMAGKLAVPIDHTNTATHVALCRVADTSLRYVTTCAAQLLTSGGTVDITSWEIGISDP